jgi:hypothetical protein
MSKPRKPHRGWMAACAIAATLADAAPASAADPALLQNLAPEIARRCVNGVISARDLGEAVIGSGLQDPLSRTDALAFLADYRLREALDDDVGDADLLSLKLLFEPDPRYAFGIAFDRGRNLDSLEFSETWKITLGIKH